MKKRILTLGVCLILTLGLCTASYAKGMSTNAPGGKNGGAGENNGKPGVSDHGFPGADVKSGDVAGGRENAVVPAQTETRNEKTLREGNQTGETVETRERVEARKGPGVKVKGKEIKFDVPPVIKEGRTLIPVRAIMNGLGADVKWDEAAKTVTVTKGDVTIVITLDSNKISVNGVEQAIDVPAQLISNRTFVPVRFVAQALKLNVAWDGETETVEIGENGQTPGTGSGTTGETADSTAGTGTAGAATGSTAGTGNTGSTAGAGNTTQTEPAGTTTTATQQ